MNELLRPGHCPLTTFRTRSTVPRVVAALEMPSLPSRKTLQDLLVLVHQILRRLQSPILWRPRSNVGASTVWVASQ